MNIKEGKAFLQECLQQCGYQDNIDKLILYKYGNIKHASNYQHDTISTDVDFSEVKPSVRFVVKCFIHLNIYAAWSTEVGHGNGKFILYKKDLVAMENDLNCLFSEKLIDGTAKVYLFRGEKGTIKFIKEKFLIDDSKTK